MEGRRFQFVIAMIIAVSLTRSVLSEPTATAAVVEFHIASQPLAQALNAWAQQSGLQLIWPADGSVARTPSRSLYGKYEPMRALALLLQDSGLQYSVLKEGTVTLGARAANDSTVVSVKDASEQP